MFLLNGYAVFVKHKSILVFPTKSELATIDTSFTDTVKRYNKNLWPLVSNCHITLYPFSPRAGFQHDKDSQNGAAKWTCLISEFAWHVSITNTYCKYLWQLSVLLSEFAVACGQRAKELINLNVI